MLFLIAQIKGFGTLSATQKTAALYKAPFLKKSRKLPKNGLFYQEILFGYFLAVFPDFYKNSAL